MATQENATLSVLLPLPPIEASLNFKPASRRGRMAQNAAVQAYKQDCTVLIKQAMRTGLVPEGPLAVQYFWFNGRLKQGGRTLRDKLCRPKDNDNAIGAAKPIQDAMAEAGLLPKGDASGRIRVEGVSIYGRASLHGGRMGVMAVVRSDREEGA